MERLGAGMSGGEKVSPVPHSRVPFLPPGPPPSTASTLAYLCSWDCHVRKLLLASRFLSNYSRNTFAWRSEAVTCPLTTAPLHASCSLDKRKVLVSSFMSHSSSPPHPLPRHFTCTWKSQNIIRPKCNSSLFSYAILSFVYHFYNNSYIHVSYSLQGHNSFIHSFIQESAYYRPSGWF